MEDSLMTVRKTNELEIQPPDDALLHQLRPILARHPQALSDHDQLVALEADLARLYHKRHILAFSAAFFGPPIDADDDAALDDDESDFDDHLHYLRQKYEAMDNVHFFIMLSIAIRKEHGFKSRWAITGIDFDAPHPYPDAKTVVYDGHWGAIGAKSHAIPGPTWMDLWRAADALITQSGNDRYIDIDRFVGDGSILELITSEGDGSAT